MNKEDKKMQEMDDDSLEGVSGGYIEIRGGSISLYDDRTGKHIGNYTDLDFLRQRAEEHGTSTKTLTDAEKRELLRNKNRGPGISLF